MTLGAQVAAQLPYLRRYARALTGSQTSGDVFVRATLEAAVADPSLQRELGEQGWTSRVALYRAFNRVWVSAYIDVAPNTGTDGEMGGDQLELAARQRLAAITPLNRQALLLTTIEDFTVADAAQIMELTPDVVDGLIQDAIAEIDEETCTRVLIIEDEPLISMQLEDLVLSLGHEIAGTAATRGQARQLITQQPAGLVLADIQLADGSSGLDAVDDILALGPVPVIFITAYPERLLTGSRPEPTYLITKPFQESAVRTAISQALFFNSSRAIVPGRS